MVQGIQMVIEIMANFRNKMFENIYISDHQWQYFLVQLYTNSLKIILPNSHLNDNSKIWSSYHTFWDILDTKLTTEL